MWLFVGSSFLMIVMRQWEMKMSHNFWLAFKVHLETWIWIWSLTQHPWEEGMKMKEYEEKSLEIVLPMPLQLAQKRQNTYHQRFRSITQGFTLHRCLEPENWLFTQPAFSIFCPPTYILFDFFGGETCKPTLFFSLRCTLFGWVVSVNYASKRISNSNVFPLLSNADCCEGVVKRKWKNRSIRKSFGLKLKSFCSEKRRENSFSP